MVQSLRFLAVGPLLLTAMAMLLAQEPSRERPPGPGRMGGFDPGWIFDRMDANKDGVVTREELTDRRSQERFEDYVRRAGVTDGRLTREAFLRAFQQRMEERFRGGMGRSGSSRNDSDRPALPTASPANSPSVGLSPASSETKGEPNQPSQPNGYRAGKLPSGLPSWFTELDKDGDGQVGMHEWKDKPLEEFLAWDRNNDGFITIAEGLRSANRK